MIESQFCTAKSPFASMFCYSSFFMLFYLREEKIATVFSDKGKITNGLWMGRAERWALNNRSPLGLKWTSRCQVKFPRRSNYFSLNFSRNTAPSSVGVRNSGVSLISLDRPSHCCRRSTAQRWLLILWHMDARSFAALPFRSDPWTINLTFF